jgi:hypothetical protein
MYEDTMVVYRGYGSGPDRAGMVLLETAGGEVLGPLSPETGPGTRPADPFTWGTPGPGVLTLGRALLADAVGTSPDSFAVAAFVIDVVLGWPEEGFTIERWQIAAWLQTHLHNRSRETR